VKRLLELDPLTPTACGQAARAYFWARHYDRAIALLEGLMEAEPTDPWVQVGLGISLFGSRRYGDPVSNAPKPGPLSLVGAELVTDAFPSWAISVPGAEGRTGPGDASRPGAGSPGEACRSDARVHRASRLGERAEALACLERACDQHAPMDRLPEDGVFS